MCVRERERDRVTSQHISYLNRSLCECVCVCVCVCERERERGSHLSTSAILIAACVCVRERETGSYHCGSVQPVGNCLNRGLFANIYELHHCVCHATLFPFQA